ncbi:hypothetical protein H4R19_002758 [Coemansia spiralis]|nr:hypothetical protein H4R19_002758 [Coemansia spiralis]
MRLRAVLAAALALAGVSGAGGPDAVPAELLQIHMSQERNPGMQRPEPMGQRKDLGPQVWAEYVNYLACVRANRGRSFEVGRSHCTCHQNGTVSCS